MFNCLLLWAGRAKKHGKQFSTPFVAILLGFNGVRIEY